MQPNWQQSKSGASLFSAHRPLRRALNLAILALLHPALLLANPNGAAIVHGQVSIDTTTPGVTNITNSPNTIIHWQNFNIAQNEITRFVQQNGQSAVLNRIIGENPSAILGQLVSNGKVFLINPNGIVFGANSVIDTQGLVASSLNLSDRDFLTGNYHFIAGSSSGNGAGNIVNEGIIRAGKNGNIILIAPSIQNNGVIKSEGGQITLAAGQELVLTSLDEPEIRYAIQAPANAVLNLGKLLTEGGAVNVFANTITHSGDINADSVTVDVQGHIKLVAQQDIKLTQGSKLSANNSQGDAGTVFVDSKTGTTTSQGTIEAKAAQTGKGGNITLLGEQVGVLGQARLNAGGKQGGGQVLVGGDKQGKNPAIHNAKATYIGADTKITADAETSGSGGKVITWADNATRAYGQISAKGGKQQGDGGFVETSGRWLDTSGIKVDASAAHGKGGEWLLDPNNITIQKTGADTHIGGAPDWTTNNDTAILTTASIQSALNNGTSVTVTTGTAGSNSQAGNITVASAIYKTAGDDAELSLNAHHNIIINAPIIATASKLDLILTPDFDAVNGGGTTINKTIDLNSGALTLNGLSTQVSGAIKNAAITIPSAADSRMNGLLSNIEEVDIDADAKLTINHGNTDFNGSFKNSGILSINAPFVMKELELDGGLLTGRGAVTVLDEFDFESGKLAGSGLFTTGAKSTTTLADNETVYLNKSWNNFGTIDWLDAARLVGNSKDNVVFNNRAGGVFNISNPDFTGIRHLNLGVFNNQGTLNLSRGILAIAGNGIDTGSYHVTGTGRLQFQDGSRIFNNGATITSVNPVSFINSTNVFNNGAKLSTPQTIIAGATMNFNVATVLNKLTMTGGALNNAKGLTVRGLFDWSGGTVSGKGDFQFNNGFHYIAGAMLATGAMAITGAGATLRLPAMPSISRLSAYTAGKLILNGDISASGSGTALTLVADGRFDNRIGAHLSALNGRWLVYANHPAKNTLGGLAPDFKHYGCAYNTHCNDAFDVASIRGNGLLYRITPMLTVTPDKLSSVYGDPVSFTSSYAGFIDGDTAATIGETGTAVYAVSGGLSGAGHYHAGDHNVRYAGGLANKLGYQFKDNATTTNEWTIKPRALNIIANPANKLSDEPDPPFTYSVAGLLTGDNLTGRLSRVGGEDVGNYPITQGNLAASTDYHVKYKAANLNIRDDDGADNDTDDSIHEGIDNEQNTVLVLTHQAGLEDRYEADEIDGNIAHTHQEPTDKRNKHYPPRQCK